MQDGQSGRSDDRQNDPAKDAVRHESVSERCPAVSGLGEDIRCELPAGHDYPHAAQGGTMTWEPIYVANLRREATEGVEYWRSLLRDVLGDLGPEISSCAIDEARDAVKKWDGEHDA